MKLSVVIPAHNEDGCISSTVTALYERLTEERIRHEILVVNDNSNDETERCLQDLANRYASVRYVNNTPPHGFGFAVRCGLREYTGDCVAVYMADASDTPDDLVTFYRKCVSENVDCVFGTRWKKGGKVYDYPWPKRILNRLANRFIQLIMQIRYDDTTNAFKLYRREVIDGLQPLLSQHFNLTVELPLKAIVRGYSYAVIPNVWINRKSGISKLKIHEMGSRYLFIVLYTLIEKWLVPNDYRKPQLEVVSMSKARVS